MEAKELTTAEFIEKVGNFKEKDWKYTGDKPCIVDFYTSTCPYCKRLEPILKEFANEYGERLYVYGVNVDREEDLDKAFDIQTVPTLMLCRTDGHRESMIGTMGKAELRKIIEEQLLK